ncbi:hypothetical protein MFLAVUS_000010 [Mucor flavus]|uniref:Coth-domain-containing protein n=1 Tax=Mucor flavus TaxID=439312 RepID=A0ABP9YIH7_9FUNG
MKLQAILKAITTAFVAVSQANNITYNVVSLVPHNQTMGVLIDDRIYPLTETNKDSTLLHYGKAPKSNSGHYKYVILLKDNHQMVQCENFTRVVTRQVKSTLNECFGRPWNKFNLPLLPTILPPLPVINRVQTKLHVDGEIPVIHLFGNQSEIDLVHKNQTSDIKIELNMTYISPKDIKSFQSITIGLSGHSTRGMSKLSYKLKMKKGTDLYGYRNIKLRATSADRSYMRDKLAYDITRSVGLPSSGYSYVRLYINNQAIGLFGVAEAFKKPWSANEFNHGHKKQEHGTLYTTDVGNGKNIFGSASDDTFGGKKNKTEPVYDEINRVGRSTCDLSYLGNNVSLYSSGQYSVKEEPTVGTANFTKIMDLTKFISQQPNTTQADNSTVSLWEERIDVDSFLRGMALEVILSNSDGYLVTGNNYMLYDDNKSGRLILSEQDFDLVMGTSMYNITAMHGGDYTEFPGFTVRPLMPRLLAVPQFKQDYESLLVNITKHLVNPKILMPVIDGLYSMLFEEVTWDQSLPRVGSDLLLDLIEKSNSSAVNSGRSLFSNATFKEAVYGPDLSNSTMNLKQWLAFRSNNLLMFFNEK